jgi:hypothetical protein
MGCRSDVVRIYASGRVRSFGALKLVSTLRPAARRLRNYCLNGPPFIAQITPCVVSGPPLSDLDL